MVTDMVMDVVTDMAMDMDLNTTKIRNMNLCYPNLSSVLNQLTQTTSKNRFICIQLNWKIVM